jgi:predicted polyphosphate/ATP-dependent NAD kinase
MITVDAEVFIANLLLKYNKISIQMIKNAVENVYRDKSISNSVYCDITSNSINHAIDYNRYLYDWDKDNPDLIIKKEYLDETYVKRIINVWFKIKDASDSDIQKIVEDIKNT